MSAAPAPGFVLLLVAIAVAVVGQVLFKLGAARLVLTPAGLLDQVGNIPLIVGFAAYFLSAILYVVALKTVPLSVAYPTLALGYVVVIAVSVLWLGETFSAVKLVGAVLICGGIFLLWR